MEPDALVEKFLKLGLSEAKAKETVKNKSLSSNLSQLIDMAGSGDLGGGVGNLLYHVASKTKPQVRRSEITLERLFLCRSGVWCLCWSATLLRERLTTSFGSLRLWTSSSR